MAGQERIFKHLEFIQTTISRKAQNSFTYKGWAITLITAVLALSDKNKTCYLAAILPLLGFWALDTYSLRQERLFRKLYDDVRSKQDTDFSMNTSIFNHVVPSFFRTLFSTVTIGLYIPILLLVIAIYFLKAA